MITNSDYLVQRMAEAAEQSRNTNNDTARQYWRGMADAYQNTLNEAFPGWDREKSVGWYVINERMTYDAALNASAPIEWEFNFVGGGWNTAWARTREEAIEKAKAEFPTLQVDEKTFHRSTPETMKANLSLFY